MQLDATRVLSRENILAAIEAVAQEKSDTEKVEELAVMELKPKKPRRSKVKAS